MKGWLEGAKNPETRRALENALNPQPPAAPPPTGTGKVSMRLKTKPKPSQAELEYEGILKREFPGCDVRRHHLKIILESGNIYTPDFVVWRGNAIVLAVEVKGTRRLPSASRAYLAISVAVTENPHIVFRLAEKRESGGWASEMYNNE